MRSIEKIILFLIVPGILFSNCKGSGAVGAAKLKVKIDLLYPADSISLITNYHLEFKDLDAGTILNKSLDMGMIDVRATSTEGKYLTFDVTNLFEDDADKIDLQATIIRFTSTPEARIDSINFIAQKNTDYQISFTVK